ncbi:MAG: hypothetical protein HY872_14255 [Chloroflexi bacterium]|nr:hypothetical protein [Chloroflexota bacterium]
MNNIPFEILRALYRKEVEQIESQRAAFIGAEISVDSVEGAGTRVRIVWRK